jgi:hypothetical protein
MTHLQMPAGDDIYAVGDDVVVFNQLAVKIEMDTVPQEDYYAWLDRMTAEIGQRVPGAQIAEKENARNTPPLNIAVYYDTPDYRVLPTGALLRTSCNRITHAFCAFKMAQDENSVRRDHRHVFEGSEKESIQADPTSDQSVAIVKRLLARTDIEHPGSLLTEHYGIDATLLEPALALEDLRYTFFVWLDKRDALRCSIDRATVYDLRLPASERVRVPFSEVELAIYPRIAADVADDPRVVDIIRELRKALCEDFGVDVTSQIKYQRAARSLDIAPPALAV